MIIESILIAIIIVCFIGLNFSLYFLLRNKRVYRLLQDILNEARKDCSITIKVIKVCRKYSYSEILYSFRTIRSFRKELFNDINKIKHDAVHAVRETQGETGDGR